MDRVSEIMIKDAVFCTPRMMINESRSLMEKHHCKRLAVVNSLSDKIIIGVINENDLVGKAGMVFDCMSKNLKVVYEDETVGECLRVMILNDIEQIPVIDKQGHFCGIVTQDKIIK
jgi:CBS domain-containing protein